MELREGEEELIEQVIIIAEKIIESAKSKKISIKFRKLLRYAYVSHTMGVNPVSVEGWNKVRSVNIRLPARITNHYFYEKVEKALMERFNIRIIRRRRSKYVVFYKGRAPPPIRLATPARSVRQYAGQKYYF